MLNPFHIGFVSLPQHLPQQLRIVMPISARMVLDRSPTGPVLALPDHPPTPGGFGGNETSGIGPCTTTSGAADAVEALKVSVL
jgi:hypothetical protein